MNEGSEAREEASCYRTDGASTVADDEDGGGGGVCSAVVSVAAAVVRIRTREAHTRLVPRRWQFAC